ncbi:calpain-7-like [Diorhabda carinulata]|uniref:calpain-7-like n=1 Tax=Diorhabda carinulata TaxID=1163345 RepID=UPI0025A2BB9E|nr:calpain-7-like [Diorhabda carinulata]
MSSSDAQLDNAIEAAKKAVQFDQQNEQNIAAYYYEAAARLLTQVANSTEDVDKVRSLNQKADQYKSRADELMNKVPQEHKTVDENGSKSRLRQCYFLLNQAIEEDEAGDKEDAIDLYAKTVEYISQFPDLMQGELKNLALMALDRAEELKGIKKETSPPSSETSPTNSKLVQQRPSINPNPQSNKANFLTATDGGYTDEEKLVLLHTSRINGRDYVPFMSVDLSERFQYSIPFSDKDGHLKLSPKQKRDFYKFVRPEEICSDPCIVYRSVPDYLSIKQTVISDCSFVASLAVSASYEKRFGKKLVTAIIYPQSKDKKPVYNPFGKYMIKLHINGIPRKVIIDDSLPIDRYGRLLCSYSANRNEFWISLLEKAYMKVMGGYDFPGSNSNIDLHALTGWIPERAAIKNNPDFNKDAVYQKIETRLAKGDVLVSVATGDMSDLEAERTGLVSTHAYAVMDVQTVDGVRLFKLKNPWSHLRWRGNYSELDTRRWTPELQRRLNFDPSSAAQFDNGVFWIDYDSLCKFFDVFYMNWNPELFKHTYCIHQSWNAGTGPVKDLYSISENPQFSLDVQGDGAGAVWLLLTRHITDIDDFRDNKEYITLFVYRGGKKVYYPFDPPPYIDGVKINSPHYLCKILLNSESNRKFTIVVSQYEKSTTIYYTLRAYATLPFRLNKIIDPYKYEQRITGEWKGITAGGCPNHPLTFPNNPKYCLDVDSKSDNNQILIELKGPKQYQMGFEVTIQQLKDESVTAPFRAKSSGSYRSGYIVLDLPSIPASVLRIIPSTFYPNQEGPFILNVKSTSPIKLFKT